MRLARITALIMLMALSGCAILRPTQKPTQRPTINQAAQQIVSSTGAIIARAAPHRYSLTYGATGGSEVGSFPNASPLSGSERILADQNSQTVNILPSQIEQYLGLPVGLSFPLSVANGGTGTSSPGLIAGTNVTITGAWPDQTINASGGSGSGTVNSGTANQVGCYATTGTAISGCGSLNVGASSVAATVPLGLDSFATASAPTCTPGQIGYANDGTGALAVCNNSDTWVSNGGTTFTIAGTGCTPTAVTGDATGGSFTLAAGPCTAVTVTFNGAVGMTAGHLWDCGVHDQTALAGGTWIPAWSQSSSTTTTATIPIPPAAGTTDTITFTCTPH